MQEDLLKIINHYGVMKQLKYFQSEVFELNEAIIKYMDFNDCNKVLKTKFELKIFKDHIAEEIADVQVMLNQFKEYYHIHDDGIYDNNINTIMERKIKRQLERIDEENK